MNINLHVISGFLGSGKTTFLKKIMPHFQGKTALIENEFGDVSVDSDLLSGDKLLVREIYSGCICCTLMNDFKTTIEELVLKYDIENIFIEPSGVGSLSDIIRTCNNIKKSTINPISIENLVTIVDVSAFNDYIETFGEFYIDQIQNARAIFLSHLNDISKEEIQQIISKINSINKEAFILNDDWFSYSGDELLDLLETISISSTYLPKGYNKFPANKIFNTISFKKTKVFSYDELSDLPNVLKNINIGNILRAKGIVKLENEKFGYFDFTPNHFSLENLDNVKETKVAVIGTGLNKDMLSKLFLETFRR